MVESFVTTSKEPSRAARPAFPWIGGKRNLARLLVERIDRIRHQTYAEPFVGAGGVFLRRHRAAPAEVINDVSRDVATFFRILQRHYTPFMEMLRYQLTGRAEFERLVATRPETLTDLERAARLLYLQNAGYGGRVRSPSFGVDPRTPGGMNVTRLGPLLEELHARLAGVVIECLPYAEFVARYDRPETLFFLDPPYWGSEGVYGAGLFGKSDFEALAELLAGLQGSFLMTINDRPEIRRIFAAFRLEPVLVTHAIGRGKQVGELIVSPKRRRRH